MPEKPANPHGGLIPMPDAVQPSASHQARIAMSGIVGAPWAISEKGMLAIQGALTAREGAPLKGARRATLVDGVAVIPIDGPLTKKASWLQEFFGGSSYESIAADFETALKSDARAIVLDIDSPGGEVSGCGELSKLIYAARGKGKKIVAYASGSMCSAAYWIGSAADEIVADPSAMLGSIGVRTLLVDASGMYEQLGIKPYDIVSKQSPLKVVDPASAEDRARVAESLTRMADVFIGDVARNRGQSPASVIAEFGRGDVLVGQQAVEAGLASRLGDMDSLLAGLAPPATPTAFARTKGTVMADASVKSGKCSGCAKGMDESDDMYCGKCKASASSAEQAFHAAVCALVGEQDTAKALGALTALKAKADAHDALAAEVDTLKKAKAEGEIKALLDAAITDGRVKPAKRAEMEKLAADFGKPALEACLANLQPSAAPAVQVPEANAPAAVTPGNAAPATHGLSADELKVAKLTGVTPEKFAAQKRTLQAIANPSSEEK